MYVTGPYCIKYMLRYKFLTPSLSSPFSTSEPPASMAQPAPGYTQPLPQQPQDSGNHFNHQAPTTQELPNFDQLPAMSGPPPSFAQPPPPPLQQPLL